MARERLKIVQVLSPTAAGGLERVVESLAIGHHRRGHEVTVATLLLEGTDEHPFVDALEESGVCVRRLFTKNRAYFREKALMRTLLREVQPDVVHTHGYRRDLLHRGVAARLGIPTVTTVHGPSKMGGPKGAFLEWLQRRNYRRFDAVVAVSQALFAETLSDGVAAERLHHVPNAWGGHEHLKPLARGQARDRLGLSEEDFVLGWVGRLIPVKGADIFLRALRRLQEPRPTAVMIGYGPEEKALRSLAREVGISDSLRIIPNIRDAARYFAAFDTFVLSSRSEGLPIVLLEAMAAGTPIVATNVGGVREAVGADNAWIVPPGDVAALAEALAHSLEDRSMAQARAGNALRRLSSRFGLEPFLDSYEQVYRRLI